MFGLTLLLGDFRDGVDVEVARVVLGIGGDGFMVAEGVNGPFTTMAQLDRDTLTRVAAAADVQDASPVITIRHIIETPALTDVYLVGAEPGLLGVLPIDQGRAPTSAGKIAVDSRTGQGIGDMFLLGGRTFQVVGQLPPLSVWAGVPVVLVTLHDAQDLVLGGSDGSTAIVVEGTPVHPIDGLRLVHVDEAVDDLTRPLKSALETISLLQWMLWLVATAIVASVLYITSLERARDFAVCKAIGIGTRDLGLSLVLQVVIMTAVSATAAIGVARLLAPAFPNVISFPARSIALVPLIIVTVGVLGSAAGARRAISIDPAAAFGSQM